MKALNALKIGAAAAAFCMVFAAASCANGGSSSTTTTTTTAATAAATEAASGTESSENAMSKAEFDAADVDTQVTVKAFVRGKQSWWEDNGVGQASIYLSAYGEEGGYFAYNMPCTQEEYDKLTTGTAIRLSGYKAEWSGEIEIIDSTFEIIDGTLDNTDAEDVTALLADQDELIKHQNEFVSFKGMTVEDSGDGAAFLYKYDNSGSEGDDLYFNVSKDGATYTFTVESYLCDSSTQVYQDVKALKVGDTIDLEGFLYWYNGPNPHITSVSAA